MKINKFLKEYSNFVCCDIGGEVNCSRLPYPHIVCNDGFTFSVQIGIGAYCFPREENAEEYLEIEVGFPSEKEDLLMGYCENPSDPTNTVYGYVPAEIVNSVIEKHGGFAGTITSKARDAIEGKV
jgi:hypothetical protein